MKKNRQNKTFLCFGIVFVRKRSVRWIFQKIIMKKSNYLFFFCAFWLPAMVCQAQAGQSPYRQENWEALLQIAQSTGKIICIKVYTDPCPNCVVLDNLLEADPVLSKYKNSFLLYKVNGETDAGHWVHYVGQPIKSYPVLLFVNGNGEEIARHEPPFSTPRLLGIAGQVGAPSNDRYGSWGTLIDEQNEQNLPIETNAVTKKQETYQSPSPAPVPTRPKPSEGSPIETPAPTESSKKNVPTYGGKGQEEEEMPVTGIVHYVPGNKKTSQKDRENLNEGVNNKPLNHTMKKTYESMVIEEDPNTGTRQYSPMSNTPKKENSGNIKQTSKQTEYSTVPKQGQWKVSVLRPDVRSAEWSKKKLLMKQFAQFVSQERDQDKYRELEALDALCQRGNCAPKVLYERAYLARELGEPYHAKVNQYLESQKPFVRTDVNNRFLYDFSNTISNNAINYFLNYLPDYKDEYTGKIINERIKKAVRVSLDTAAKQRDTKMLEKALRVIEQADLNDPVAFSFEVESNFYKQINAWDKYMKICKKYIDGMKKSNPELLNEIAWTCHQYIRESGMLKQALEWAIKSVKTDSQFYNNFTCASLLLKLGDKEMARKVLIQAIEIAKVRNVEYQKAVDLLDSIESR